ncbi:MAG: radical SAM protein [Alphaproteobacteria bacterium]|nr:radical SAM protein [Alphaproteobacteria bacterium]
MLDVTYYYNVTMRSIQLSVSNKCLRNCKGCYNFFANTDNFIDCHNVITFIKQLQQDIKLNKVTVTGGDPLYREDLPKLLEELKAINIKINLDTTGLRLLDEDYDASFIKKYVDVLGIPLDGGSDSVIKTFRQSLDKPIETTLQILHKLEGQGINVCINTMVHKFNLSEMVSIAKLISGFNNIVKWQLFQYMPIGPGDHAIKQQMYITEEEFFVAVNEVKQQLSTLNKDIKIEAKTSQSRRDKYIFISPMGIVWCPDKQDDDKRIMVGDIKNSADYHNILNFIQS